MLPANQVARRQESYWSTMLASLHYRDYRLIWLGSFAEHIGEFMEVATILWLVNDLTHSPLMLTIVGSSRWVAMLFLPILGGVVADRVNRRNLLLVALIAAALLSTALAILALTRLIAVWHLIAITFFTGVAMSFNHPARNTIVPNLVKREHLLNAISLELMSVYASSLVSMLLVGYAISSIGIGPIFIIRVAGCLLAIGWLLLIHVPQTSPNAKKQAPWHNLREGFHYLRGEMIITALIVLYILPLLVGNTYTNFIPIFANDILQVGAVGYGYLQAAPGLGATLSLIGLTTLTYYKRKATLLAIAGIIMGIGLIAFSFSSWMYLSLLVLAVIGAAQIGFSSVNMTLVQSAIPDEMRGRVMSWREIAFGLGPIGSIIFGGIAQHTGVPTSLALLGGICLIVSLLVIGFLPRFRKIE